jgi:small subunit ribosomal protein S1
MAKNDRKTRDKLTDELFAQAEDGETTTAEATETFSFAQLLAQGAGRASGRLKVGDAISGEVLSVTKEEIFVATGTPVDGTISVRDFAPSDARPLPKVGDRVEAVVVRLREDQILLRPKSARAGSADVDSLEDAFDMEIPVEGKVVEAVNGGFRVLLSTGGVKAFCPISQLDSKQITDGSIYINKKFDFLITQFDSKGRNIVVSRRKILDQLRAESEGEFMASVKPGDLVEGRVTRLEKFGAFVELRDGVEGLVHISELSFSRIREPQEAVSIGQQVTLKVLKIEDIDGRLRISLSLKQGPGVMDPWLQISESLPVGSVVEGVIEKRESFGLFVQVAPAITGLLPKSKWRDSDGQTFETRKRGDRLRVRVEQVQTDLRRLTLGLPSADEDESWKQHTPKSQGGFGSMADALKGLKRN